MKQMYVVDGKEYEVGKTYSKNDVKRFKKAENFEDALSQLTNKKNMIVMVEEIIEEKSVFKIVEEIDNSKIFNSDTIEPLLKLAYLIRIRELISISGFKIALEEFESFANSCTNIEFSYHLLQNYRLNYSDKVYVNHLENLLQNDLKSEYLYKITSLRDSQRGYAKIIVDKLMELSNKTGNLKHLLDFMSRVSKTSSYYFIRELDLYYILGLLDIYDNTGKYYVALNKIVPYFEIRHIQDRIIDLANKNKNSCYCYEFLKNNDSSYTLKYPKILKVDELIETIFNFWNEDDWSIKISVEVFEYASTKNLYKLLDKYKHEYDIRIIKSYLENRK